MEAVTTMALTHPRFARAAGDVHRPGGGCAMTLQLRV
jgi:hypothetical protein